jgi:hypothetical protein
MSHDSVVGRALLALREQIVKEEDPAQLRQLVLEINALLGLVETQVAKLERRDPPFLH